MRLALTAFALLLACSCKSGDPLTSAIVPTTAGFQPEIVGATQQYVALQVGSQDRDRIRLEVLVADVTEMVSGINLRLTYPSTISRFVACSDGDLFSDGDCFFSETRPGSGEVFVGRSVTGPGQAGPVVGQVVALRLDFLVFADGQGPLVIEAQNLGGGESSALVDENGDPIPVDWFSGILSGMQ